MTFTEYYILAKVMKNLTQFPATMLKDHTWFYYLLPVSCFQVRGT